MPPRSEVENDGRGPERHQQVELGRENDDPDAPERPLDRPSRGPLPGRRRGRPQPTVGHLLRGVDLETAHLDLRRLHLLVWAATGGGVGIRSRKGAPAAAYP